MTETVARLPYCRSCLHPWLDRYLDGNDMPISLEHVVSSDRLPSLPQVAVRVIELAREVEVDFDEVTRTVRTDPALSAKLLKTVNSALYGLRRRVDSIEQAIPLLGISAVRTIVLGFTLAEKREGASNLERPLQRLWRSSLTQATVAELLASESPGADPSSYFLAGLLQDIGILALLYTQPEDYLKRVWEVCDFPNVLAAERQCFGYGHTDISRAMCERWRLPAEMCHAIAVHHNRLESVDAKLDSPMSTALQAASLAAHYITRMPRASDRDFAELASFLLRRYNWGIERTEELLHDAVARVGEIASMYSFDIGAGLPVERILDDAKRILEEIALHSQFTSMAETQAKLNSAVKARSKLNRLEEELVRDALTGVYNRRFLNRALARKLATWIGKRQTAGFLFLDIDRFKSINDSRGHALGDKAIRVVAKILQKTVRRSDYVIRYGGDEFLVVLHEIPIDGLQRLADRILVEIRQTRLQSGDHDGITTSIGAVHYQPVEGDSLDANWLIDLADQGMYEAKRNGGDQLVLRQLVGSEPTYPGSAIQLV